VRLLYLGDMASPLLRVWAEHFAGAGHDVHACHLAARPIGELPSGVTMHPAPRPLRFPVRGSWRAAAVPLHRLWRRLRPDVVHSHQVVPWGYLCELARLRPHVCTAWGSELLRSGIRARRLAGRVACDAQLITAPAHHLLKVMRGAGADPARLRWVPWGISDAWRRPALGISRAEAAERLGLPTERPILLSHRGTGPVYRQDVVVKAMARVRARHPDALCAILAFDASPGRASETRVREMIELAGLGGSAIVLPALPHRRMALAYRAAAVCLSVPESEGAPSSVFEALSVRAPVIVSDLPWVHEPVHREARLRVVPVGDHDALAEAIVAALESPSEEDAEHNLRLVERSFDRDRVLSAFGLEYERIAGRDG
jgi:glycosyltransferase involved in cell wall biosynthesis